MKKLNIYIIFSIISIIFGIIGFLLGANVIFVDNSVDNNKFGIVWVTDGSDGQRKTMLLYDKYNNYKCEFPGGYDDCKWDIKKSTIELVYIDYVLTINDFDVNSFTNKNACLEVLKTVYSDKKDAKCISRKNIKNAVSGDDGTLIMDGDIYINIG